MHIGILDQHQILGIDFDGTLVEHPRSHILQRYILDHPEKTFFLISFRTHNMRDRIADHLRDSTDETGVPLTIEHFAGVHCIADMFYEQRNLTLDHGVRYWSWKAQKCVELGCTIMVDDLYEMIGIYCEALGIPCLNPDIHEGYMEPEIADFNDSCDELMDWLRTDRGQVGECAGDTLNELYRRGRIVWYYNQAALHAHLSWPPPNDFCWVALAPEKFKDIRIKAIEVLGSEADAILWLEQEAMGLPDRQRPIDAAMTLEGAVQVEELLGRIEHGVYT